MTHGCYGDDCGGLMDFPTPYSHYDDTATKLASLHQQTTFMETFATRTLW
jgi:hypothetical protein